MSDFKMIELEEPEMKALVERMLKGDPRCPIPINARIEKTNTEPGDLTKDGHRGYVRGGVYSEEVDMSLYMIEWDNITIPTEINGGPVAAPYVMIADFRIKQIT